MVEVVTSKAFTDFKKSIEKRLDANEKKIESLVKDVDDKYKHAQANLEDALKVINKRIDNVEESSKSFVVRLREAVASRSEIPEEKPSQI